MASPFLGLASGITQGLASSIQSTGSLMLQRQQMALQQQQADAANIQAFSNSLKIPDPAMRDLAVGRLMKPALGIDPTSDVGKKTLATIKQTSDDNLATLAQALPGMPKSALFAIASDPAEMANMLYKITTQKNLQTMLGNLPTPENPSGTGDMGTGTAGAGGTVVAPTADAGTSVVGSQPAVSPAPAPAATGTTAPPATTTSTASPPPKPGVVSQPGTGPGQTLPKVAVGQGPNGQVVNWDPNTDPYVRNMQKAILYASTTPGVTPEIMSALNSRLTQYVDGQKFKFTQFIDMQNLSLHSKEVGISAYHAALDREHLTMEEQAQVYHQTQEPLSELGKEQADKKRGNLPASGATDGVVSSTIGSTDTRQLPATLTALPSTEVQLPSDVKPDLGKATNNGDGSFTITDAATLKAAGVTDPTTRLVIDAPTGKAYFQTATPTSMRTAANLDEAQIGLNLVQRGYNFADSTAKLVAANPQSFGAYGSAKAGLQTWIGIAKDIAAEFPDAKSLLAATGLSKLPFNPIAPTLDGISQFMKAYVTKTLTVAGGAAGLSAYGVTDKSIEDLTNVGAGSSNDVQAHLGQIKNLMAQAKQDFQSRLPNGGQSGVPDTTTSESPTAESMQGKASTQKQEETPLQSKYDKWQSMSKEEQKPLIGTKYDMRPSNFESDGDSHLAKIPVGQIILLRESLKLYTNPTDQKTLKDLFKLHFGKTAVARVGLD